MWYARKGFPAAGGVPCGSRPPPPPVSQYLELRVKHTPEGDWETLELDSTLRGVVVLNLQSYGGMYVGIVYATAAALRFSCAKYEGEVSFSSEKREKCMAFAGGGLVGSR